MKKFELTNVAKYLKTTALKCKDESILEQVKLAVEKDGYHSFNNRDLVMLLIHKLENHVPHRMKASTMLREIGILNIYNTDDDNILMKLFQYCCGIIIFIKPKNIEKF